MKKFSIAVCVCAVLFSFSNYGECVREVSAQTSGAEENLAILQDIIRENECQAGMAFLGYTYENADTSEILEYTRQEELAAAYPFLQDGTVVDAGGYEIYAIVPGLDCKISIYPTQVTEEGEYLEDLNSYCISCCRTYCQISGIRRRSFDNLYKRLYPHQHVRCTGNRNWSDDGKLPWGGKPSGACVCLSDRSQRDKSCAGLHIS